MISVCLATFNGEKYIKDQVKSILLQLNEEDELIISDDSSTDDTIKILRSFEDSRIKIYNNTKLVDFSNKQQKSFFMASANFINALNHAKGNVIFLSDQDDIWYQNKVEVCMNILTYSDLVLSNLTIMDSNENIIIEKYFEKNPLETCSFITLLRTLPFRGCCLAFNNKVLDAATPFPKYTFLHDNWIGLSAKLYNLKISYTDVPLIKYRRHRDNVSELISPNSFFRKFYYRFTLLLQLIIHKYMNNEK